MLLLLLLLLQMVMVMISMTTMTVVVVVMMKMMAGGWRAMRRASHGWLVAPSFCCRRCGQSRYCRHRRHRDDGDDVRHQGHAPSFRRSFPPLHLHFDFLKAPSKNLTRENSFVTSWRGLQRSPRSFSLQKNAFTVRLQRVRSKGVALEARRKRPIA
jgi:hypothetical protein